MRALLRSIYRFDDPLTPLYIYQILNSLSFWVVQGAPMLLYLKHLGASATTLGVAAALYPLLAMLQLPASRFIADVGYRRFLVRGWTARTAIILGMAVVAFLPVGIDGHTKIALMLLFLFGYFFFRGISVGSWLPWMTQLLPESKRGLVAVRDTFTASLGNITVLMIAATLLKDSAHAGHCYGWLFLASAVIGFVSLVYLRQVPDPPVPEEDKATGPFPWRACWSHLPFRRLLAFSVLFNTASAGMSIIWVPLFRDRFGISESSSLTIVLILHAMVVVFMRSMGRWVDHTGSRPVLIVCGTITVLHAIGWALIAAGLWPFSLATILWQQLTAAIGTYSCLTALGRLAMEAAPAAGRSRFLAFYGVMNNCVLGFLPIAWGLALDAIGNWEHAWGRFHWNQFSVLYGAAAILLAAATVQAAGIIEPKAMHSRRFLLEMLLRAPGGRRAAALVLRRTYPEI